MEFFMGLIIGFVLGNIAGGVIMALVQINKSED